MEDNIQPRKTTFKQFLDRFPVVTLPLHLNEDSHHLFSTTNLPLSHELVATYILPAEGKEDFGEFTEVVACCQLPKLGDFHALIYWLADLLDYRYKLITFSPKGQLIDRCELSGMRYEGERLFQSVTTIEADGSIIIAEGWSKSDGSDFKASDSKAQSIEINADGYLRRL